MGYEDYRWAKNPDPVPLAPLSKPLTECTVAVVASGGVYRHGQVAFHHRDDLSIRTIPSDTPSSELRTSHFAYDLTNSRRDPNVVLPLEALRNLDETGEIGGLASHALTFMGGIYSQRRLNETVYPAIADQLTAMAADVVLLVPV